MAIPGQMPDDWIAAWIEGQKAMVQRWLDGQRAQSHQEGPNSLAAWFHQIAAAAQPASEWDGFGKQWVALRELWGATLPEAVNSWRGLPEIGPLREQQASLKGLAGAVADYERFAVEMAALLAKVHADTLDLLARRATEQANGGQPVDGFKALHALWIECGETVYARVAHEEAYVRLQADLCNAAIQVQSHKQQQMERWLKQFDLPTRSELNTLHRQVADLKRQVEARAQGTAPPSAAGKSRSPAKRKPARKP